MRNQVKHLSSLQPAPAGKPAERLEILRDHKWHEVVAFLVKNKWQRFCYVTYINRNLHPVPLERAFFFPRERLLGRALGLGLFASLVTGNAGVESGTIVLDPELLTAPASVGVVPGPRNWLDGVPEFNGFRKDALSGPLQYAKDSGYEFAATKTRLIELVEEGTLVELEETESLKFNDVSRPYVLPVVAEFVYRLADQYNYGEQCGPLVLNGAARDIAFQRTLGNGSDKSVHPAGMAVDFKSTGHTPRCAAWLEGTLLEIEAAKRIDFTKEVSEQSPHYHVTVATHEYERWLERRRTVNDSETDWLRKAIFYEGGPNETIEGFRAIGWVIRNRVRSKEYPNTIQAVVADGSAGEHNGGCQFSFMCDGKVEDRYELCRNESGKLTSYWRFKCDMRWEQVTMIAKAVMSETEDPTGGAVLYYATWMKPAPPWAKPRVEKWSNGSIVILPFGDFAHQPKKIGNHFFGCSKFAGSDVCRV
ncbi:MAG: hypothetical protein RLZZ480_839 [Candidatus Parcubacteria bacterium]|jgi:spore germination cell wall hydrolase CwlJ-like protein